MLMSQVSNYCHQLEIQGHCYMYTYQLVIVSTLSFYLSPSRVVYIFWIWNSL